MKLDQRTVTCSDNRASAQFYAEAFGFREGGTKGNAEVLYIDDTTKLFLENHHDVTPTHYRVHASAGEYDSVLSHIIVRGIPYGDAIDARNNESEYRHTNNKGFFFEDPDGHILEVTTDIA